MAPTYRIAAIQLYVKPFRPDLNHANAVKHIRSAAAQGCHLAVLPEFHLTNWVPADPRFRAACEDWESYLQKYVELAKELNICIVPGTIVQIRKKKANPAPGQTNHDYENVTYFIDNTGNICGKYVKKNLWGPTERNYLTCDSAQEPHQVVDTPLGKVGLLICWDLAYPEAWRDLVRGGAKIIILPTLWTRSAAGAHAHAHHPAGEMVFLDSIMTARAFEGTCAVVFANAGGPPGKNYCGQSQITVPWVGPLVRLGSSAEGMAVADLDMAILEQAEENYQIRADLARSDWHYGYEKRPVLKEKL